MEETKKNKTGLAVVTIIFWIIDFVVSGYVAAYTWNQVVTVLFGLRAITFWQAWALYLVKAALIGGYTKSGDIKLDDYVWKLIADIILTALIAMFVYILKVTGCI